MVKNTSPGRVRVTLIKSLAGRLPVHQRCIAGLGLKRMHQTVELVATDAAMGMVRKAAFMLRIEQI
ncbi:MAG: 50S ribosomal protein L30 [Nevskiaceae bacterium]|nr:MAG: 50S ribosomal protein L30 [Nevskiaceae bacterium]TBR72966.1 MAG: 50S ribosomal protein L30 [Nevskiaceae bacterium]